MRPDSRLIPFVIQREGEEAAPDNLRLTPLGGGRYRLGYADEDPATVTSAACCGRAAASGRRMRLLWAGYCREIAFTCC